MLIHVGLTKLSKPTTQLDKHEKQQICCKLRTCGVLSSLSVTPSPSLSLSLSLSISLYLYTYVYGVLTS